MSFYKFTVLLCKLESESKYTEKTRLIREHLMASIKNDKEYDVFLCCKLLLIKEDQRVFHLKDKTLLKVFASCVPGEDVDELQEEYLKGGDSSKVLERVWRASGDAKKMSSLTLSQVDQFLDQLTKLTKHAEQQSALGKMLKLCTATDIKWIARLIIGKLRKAKIGAKYVCGALHTSAFDSYKSCQNLKLVVEKFSVNLTDEQSNSLGDGKKVRKVISAIGMAIFQPVKPMLAKVSKSYQDVMKRCPQMRVELKYDGERIQIHMRKAAGGAMEFKFYSRSLKPVLEWKVKDLKEFIPKAAPGVDSVVLDAEILLLSKEGQPLPFGSLNKNKQSDHAGATTALFVFDILQVDGESLMDKPFDERRAYLERVLTPIPGRVQFSRLDRPKTEEQLKTLMQAVIHKKQEGLIIKDGKQLYQPNKRAWLKIKKEHVGSDDVADTLDLIAVGAYYGTGAKGGLLTTLLMAVLDKDSGKYLTVCKCGNGLDDETLTSNQESWKQLFQPFSATASSWLLVQSKYKPDAVAVDPKLCPVYEVLCSEFSDSNHHTADGISMRFPRFVRLRQDKNFETATSFKELKAIVRKSESPVEEEEEEEEEEDDDEATQSKRRKRPAPVHVREECTYDASGCNRENPVHFKSFSHPKKQRNKPMCQYGDACYRENPLHWKQHRHPDESVKK